MPEEATSADITGTIDSRLLSEYYESIRESFEKTYQYRLVRDNWVSNVLLLLSVFSVLPIFPYILSRVLKHFAGAHSVTILHKFHIALTSFWVVWPACFGLSFLLFAWRMRTIGVDVDKQLTLSQMRFAYAYGIVDELTKYQTNRRTEHIFRAESYLRKLAKVFRRLTFADYGLFPRPAHMFNSNLDYEEAGISPFRGLTACGATS
jgi:hypothetical protein